METIITKAYLKNLSKLSKISGIYKITSPSGKIYIGQSINLYRRLKSYFEPNSAKNQKILKYSFDKYGAENHIFEIIEECDVKSLNSRERYWQEFYKENLLNSRFTESDDKSGYCLQQTKDNISKALKNTDASWKHLKKKIYQYSEKGVFIKEFESIREASRILDINCSAITKALNPDSSNKSAKGFLWSFEKLDLLEGSVGQSNKLKIEQYNLKGEIVNVFDSVTEAAKMTKSSKASIIRCCKGKQKTCNGFYWSYEEKVKNLEQLIKIVENMNTEDKKKAIMEAFKSGKTIQSNHHTGRWEDFEAHNQLDRPNLNYGSIDNWRIKPD